VSADIRRQLEGGIETLEAALARYSLVEKALRQKRWQEEILARLETLRELIDQEPGLLESLTRLRQRARVEGWPDTEPALVLSRKVEKLRTRLYALTHERLGSPEERESLTEKLARLHQVLARTIAPPVSSEERVLHQGVFERHSTMPVLPILLMIGFIASIRMEATARAVILWCLLLLSGFVPLPFLSPPWALLERRRSGRFWLTSERLVWQPTGRDPLHIPLQAIHPGGVRLCSASGVEVRLVDGRELRLHSIQGAEQLVTLLARHR
jgi:hypothetical protein